MNTIHDLCTIATACIHRCDQGDQFYTLPEAVERVRHPMTGVSKDDALTVIAYLSCQVVGLQRSQDADAKLALVHVRTALADFDNSTARKRMLNEATR